MYCLQMDVYMNCTITFFIIIQYKEKYTTFTTTLFESNSYFQLYKQHK